MPQVKQHASVKYSLDSKGSSNIKSKSTKKKGTINKNQLINRVSAPNSSASELGEEVGRKWLHRNSNKVKSE